MVATSTQTWSETSYWSEEAEQAFAKARRAAEREDRLDRRSRDTAPEPFADIVARLRLHPDPELQAAGPVPLDRIVGSVSRDHQFSSSFWPRSDRLRPRWKRVYAIARGLVGHEPVELYRVGDDYYVVDGHFRISVARSLHGVTIDAVVQRWR